MPIRFRHALSGMAGIILAVLVASCATAAHQHPITKAGSIASCVRHDPVGFFTTPEVLGELGQVYANCDPQPVCAGQMVDLQTIQIDGYINSTGWLWMGLSTTTFNVAQQDAIIADAISRAGLVAPTGKVIVSIAFFRDIIVGNGPDVYVIYFQVTFGRCNSGSSSKGMTWRLSSTNSTTGTIDVGCGYSSSTNECNAYTGDTDCSTPLPVLCFKPAGLSLPANVDNTSQYHKWSGGIVATTPPVAGNSAASPDLTTIGNANAYCASQFGSGWRVAEFHDGWGWYFQAYGGVGQPTKRFWVHINDQPAATCWH